jgi:hypothetical protein
MTGGGCGMTGEVYAVTKHASPPLQSIVSFSLVIVEKLNI